MGKFRLIAAALICGLLALPAWADNLIFGVQDYSKDPRMLELQFRGMAKYLSRELGQPVIVEAARSYGLYMQSAQNRRYALMFGPPNMILQAHAAGYDPVARIPGRLSAAFVSLAQSGIAFPEDMKGKRLGMPDPDSLMAQLAMSKLAQGRMSPERGFARVLVLKSPDDALSALKLGLIDVGVVNSTLYEAWSARGYNLNLIAQSDSAPNLTFAVRNNLPAPLKAKLIKALMAASRDPDAASYFKITGFPGFEPASLKDLSGLAVLRPGAR